MVTLDKMPLRKADYWILAVGSMEQMIGGALATVIGVMLPMIKIVGHPEMASWVQGIVGAMGLIGIGFGSLFIGKIIDKHGYLFMFRLCPLLMVAGSIICFFWTSLFGLILGLFVIGIGVGGGYTLDSSYISELMPSRWRMIMVGAAKATCSLGFIGAAVVCYFIIKGDENPHTWPHMIVLIGLLGVITFLMRLRWAESPQWLLARGEKAKAEQALQTLLGKDIAFNPQCIDNQDNTNNTTASKQKKPFSVKENLSRIIFSGIPWACEGLGVYGFSVFLPVLVMALGLKFDSASVHGMAKVLGSVEVTAAVNFFILPGFALGLILLYKKFNNVKMLFWGFLLSAFGLLLLLASYLLHWPVWVMMIGFIIYEISLNAGPHIITYIIPPKIYPVEDRGQGTGIADIMGKAGAVTGVILMPILLEIGGMTLVLSVSAAVMLTGALIGQIYGKKLGLIS